VNSRVDIEYIARVVKPIIEMLINHPRNFGTKIIKIG
jgi:hypothetical protein